MCILTNVRLYYGDQPVKPIQLVLRCYAVKDEGVWVASCIDLSLAVQGDSFEEVKEKLEAMIGEYVYDATVGEDREYAGQLLTRKAPYPEIVKYYWYLLLLKLGSLKQDIHRLFTEALPLAPCNHHG